MHANSISTLAVRGGRGEVMGIGLLIALNFKLIFLSHPNPLLTAR